MKIQLDMERDALLTKGYDDQYPVDFGDRLLRSEYDERV
jgi:hypothetical protein